MEISLISEPTFPQHLREEWNTLLEHSENPTVFNSFEWHNSWWQCFGDGHTLLLFLAREAGKLAGIAPLMKLGRPDFLGAPGKICFIGSSNFASDYCDFIISKGKGALVGEFIDALSAHAPDWQLLDLFNFPEHSANFKELEEVIARRGLYSYSQRLYDAPAILLSGGAEDKKLLSRQSLKRPVNWFKRQGSLVFRHCEDIEEIEGWLELFFTQHIARRAGTESASFFVDPRHQEFFRVLAREGNKAGWLRFSVELLNDKPIAFHYGFEFNGVYVFYKPAFDVSITGSSPGAAHLRFMLEYCVEHGIKEFDFTVGAEDFKYRYANTIRDIRRLRLYRRRSAYVSRLLLEAVKKAGRRAKKMVAAAKSGAGDRMEESASNRE